MNKKILIVEDELSLRHALIDKLQEEGFLILEAKDGEEGLAKALVEHPDLILLDLIMPKMDGWQMLSKLRADSWGNKAKVVVLTNLSDIEQVAKATEDNVVGFLVKSNWKIEDLARKVKEILHS